MNHRHFEVSEFGLCTVVVRGRIESCSNPRENQCFNKIFPNIQWSKTFHLFKNTQCFIAQCNNLINMNGPV